MTDDERDREIEASIPEGIDGELTAIPDGGLGDTMPDWLRRPPAWRGMPLPEVAETAPETDAESVTVSVPATDDAVVHSDAAIAPDASKPRVLPEPDRSPIDPESLIELSDLPGWLVGLGKRVPPPGAVSLQPRDEPEVAKAAVDGAATGEAIALRSQAEDSDNPTNTTLRGIGSRALVIAGVIAVVVLLVIVIAQFG